jgi:Tfp pilus assembly protein PilX
MNRLLTKTKRGGASMFVVMFTVIVLSIITLSFTRLILAEATKTSKTDLSQSAYDSALAGVEDAKIALLRYHACLDQGKRAVAAGDDCEKLVYRMQQGIDDQDCSTIQKVLEREQADDTHGVVVQETQTSDEQGNNTSMLQAYTCVTLQEDLEDYRTTLDSASRLRIIPVRASKIDTVKYIRLRWFSAVNLAQLSNSGASAKWCSGSVTKGARSSAFLFPNGSCDDSYKAPPLLSVRLIQTDESFNLSELSAAKAADQTDTGNLFLLPRNSVDANNISASAWGESANKAENKTTDVNCSTTGGPSWICDVTIELPKTFRGDTDRSDSNTYLLVSIPYGSPETDVSVQTLNENKKLVEFTGVQARIDSTGRANDLYRRVETRVELVDTYFAYPEFEITMVDSSSDVLSKTFYATFNCWTADNGRKTGACLNTLEDKNYSLSF